MGKTEYFLIIILFNIFFIAFITAIIAYVKQYKIKKREHGIILEIQQEKHQQELLATQLEMQTQTMQHIGREIHDNVGQKLTLASLYTQQLAYENKAPQINDKIETISEIINESLAELRQLSKSLTDDSINESNIFELLQHECEKVNNLMKCVVVFSSNQKNILLSYQTKSILLRIVQEFLQNSIKHAHCKNIQVLLHTGEAALQLSLQDDGKGFDTATATGQGIGLTNMKKRTALLSGTFQMESKPGNGTQLYITIPL